MGPSFRKNTRGGDLCDPNRSGADLGSSTLPERITNAVFTSAISSATSLGGEVSFFAVWDGSAPEHATGTAADLSIWRDLGLPVHLIPSEGVRLRSTAD